MAGGGRGGQRKAKKTRASNKQFSRAMSKFM